MVTVVSVTVTPGSAPCAGSASTPSRMETVSRIDSILFIVYLPAPSGASSMI